MATSWILKWGLTQLGTNFALWAMSDIFRYFGYVTFSLVGTFCIVLPVTPYESSFTWSFCANFVSIALVVCPCWVSCFLAASLFLFSSVVWPLNSWGSVNVLERGVPWCRWGEKDVIPGEKKIVQDEERKWKEIKRDDSRINFHWKKRQVPMVNEKIKITSCWKLQIMNETYSFQSCLRLLFVEGWAPGRG